MSSIKWFPRRKSGTVGATRRWGRGNLRRGSRYASQRVDTNTEPESKQAKIRKNDQTKRKMPKLSKRTKVPAVRVLKADRRPLVALEKKLKVDLDLLWVAQASVCDSDTEHTVCPTKSRSLVETDWGSRFCPLIISWGEDRIVRSSGKDKDQKKQRKYTQNQKLKLKQTTEYDRFHWKDFFIKRFERKKKHDNKREMSMHTVTRYTCIFMSFDFLCVNSNFVMCFF